MRYLLSIALLCGIILSSFIPMEPYELEEPIALSEPEEKEVVFTEDPGIKLLVDGLADAYGLNPDHYAVTVVNYATGQYYAYNAAVPFTAASLYKLPLAMLYYEDFNNGVLPANQALTYLPEHYEGPGNLGDLFYTDIPVSELLHYMIQNSDNNSAHVLYENRQGWPGYIAQRSRYASFKDNQMVAYQQQLDQMEMEDRQNQVTAAYMTACLAYLIEHQEEFPVLIEDLAIAEPVNFLNGKLPSYYNQKYGNIGSFLNIAGFSLENDPYSIVILTVSEEMAEGYMADLGVLMKDYFNPDSVQIEVEPAQDEQTAQDKTENSSQNVEYVIADQDKRESLYESSLKPE